MSSVAKRKRQLQEIYASIPSIACKGLCWESCAAVPVYDAELVRLEEVVKRKLPVMAGANIGPTHVLATDGMKNPRCPQLVFGRCSIYADRPLICRLFGVAEGLPCPHGCVPTETISDRKVMDLQRKVERL